MKKNNKKPETLTQQHRNSLSLLTSILCRILSCSTDTRTIKISWLVNGSACRGVQTESPRQERALWQTPLGVMDSADWSGFCPEIFPEVFPSRAVRSACAPSFRGNQSQPSTAPALQLCPGCSGPSAPASISCIHLLHPSFHFPTSPALWGAPL